MYIDITMICGDKSLDIRIDDRQSIGGAVSILKKKELVGGTFDSQLYRSRLRETIVSGNKTFRESGIISGDVLVAVT
jgi:uncharacterized ubiquitin-like protein YukD